MKADKGHSLEPRRVPAPLAEYAEHLLIGTGLDAAAALEIASGERDAPPELARVEHALRAGWQLSEEIA